MTAGSTITIQNNDGVNHTFTEATTGSFGTPFIPGNTSTSFTLPANTPKGTYNFKCSIHPTLMTGQIVVE